MTDEIDSAFQSGRSDIDVLTENVDGVVVLSVAGAVDAATAPELNAAIDDVFGDTPTAVVIDLAGVTFLASVGMTILMTTTQRAGADVRLAVVADGVAVRRPLTLLGLDTELNLHLTREDALSSVSKG